MRRRQQQGWGLPRADTADSPGSSWEGEGRQARQDPPRRGRRWRALVVVALGLLLGAGALLLAGRDGQPDRPLGTDRENQDTAEVEPGACLASLPADRGQPLDVVGCDDQHLGEVVAVLELDDHAWPGDVAVASQGRDRCAAQFQDYVGVPVEDSGLGLLPVAPRENDWRVDGDRTVVCLAEGPALVGSVRGSGR